MTNIRCTTESCRQYAEFQAKLETGDIWDAVERGEATYHEYDAAFADALERWFDFCNGSQTQNHN